MSSDLKKKILVGVLGGSLLLVIGIPGRLPVETLPMNVEGVVPSGGTAKMCIGYNVTTDEFGYEQASCPANYAYYGVDDPGGKKGPAAKIRVSMSCCPLPSNDILTEEHVFVEDECPIDSVATGSKTEGHGESRRHLMKCTKINSGRYQLGNARAAKYWGEGAAGWYKSDRIRWDNIPAGIRYSNGRQGETKWDVDGCVGYPWGSLLTKKTTKYCSGFFFRQLQFTGVQGDPVSGTPVKMFASCDDVLNLNEPANAHCVANPMLAAR